jgi:protein TonB
MKTAITVFLLALYALFSPAIARSQDTTRVRSAKDTADYDKTFVKVEIESSFPGGSSAWLQFLQNHLVYPKKAVRQRIEGTVMLQFIVDKEGNVTDLQAISGDPILAEAALKAMAGSPRWIPATQFGRKVKSYKKQPVVFRFN